MKMDFFFHFLSIRQPHTSSSTYIDHISALCLRERVHPLSKKIDGAVITSKAENNLDCTITFQTDTILQKFMLRFEKLALDCNDHLYIYDGAHTIGNHKVCVHFFSVIFFSFSFIASKFNKVQS